MNWEKQKQNVLAYTSGGVGLFILVLAIFRDSIVEGFYIQGLIVEFFAILMISVSLLSKFSKFSLKILALIFCCIASVMVFFTSIVGYGVSTPGLIGLVVVPIIAMLLIGRRWGLVFGATSVLLVVSCYALEFFGLISPKPLPDGISHLKAALLCIFSLAALYVSWCYQYFHESQNSELIRLNSRLRETLEKKLSFFAGISHDLRTPLNAIIGLSDLIKEDVRDGNLENVEKDIGTIHSSGHHLLSLINDLMSLVKMEAGKMDFTPKSFDLGEFFENIDRTGKAIYAEQNNKIVVNSPGHITFHAPEMRIKQVLINLLSNAVKFTQNGLIEIDASVKTLPEGRVLSVVVKDNGEGIPEEKQKSIFEAFNQVDATREQESKGTGLGLALVKSMVLSMNGTIEVKSQLGKGSDFTITIPEFSGSEVQLPSKARALIVDDDTDVSDLMSEYLSEGTEFEVHVAQDGLEALELINKFEFQLLIVDYQMPRMNGIELLKKIHEDSLVTDDKIVFLCTGVGEIIDRVFSDMEDIDIKVISKPFTYSEFLSAIKSNRKDAA